MSCFAQGFIREVIVALVVGGLAANLTLAANGGHPTKPASAAPADRVEERLADLTSDWSPEAAEAAAWAALVDFQVGLYQRLFTTPFERGGEEPLRVAGPITGLGYEHSLPGFRPQTGEWLYFTPLWIGAERPYPRTRIEGVGEIVGGQVQEAIGWLESARSFEPEAVLVIIATVDLADGARHSLLLPMMAVDDDTILGMLAAEGSMGGSSNVSIINDCYGGRFDTDPIYVACKEEARLQYLNDLNDAVDDRAGCLRDSLTRGLSVAGLCMPAVGAAWAWGGFWGAVLAFAVCAVAATAAGLATWHECTSTYTRKVALAYQTFLARIARCCIEACYRSSECRP